MKFFLTIQLLMILFFSSANAQRWFLGKSEKTIRDSLFKIDYYQFNGMGFPDKRYQINFSYYDYHFLKDTSLSNGKTTFTMDTLHLNTYTCLFKDDICVVSSMYRHGFKDYQKVIAYLDANYKKNDSRKWISYANNIEIKVNKEQDGFWVSFKKVEH